MSTGRYADRNALRNRVLDLGSSWCLDCGSLVADRETHDRFHAIGNDQARAIAVLLNSHVSAKAHDKYNVRDRLPTNHNNWSREAFDEVVASIEDCAGSTSG